MAKTTGLLQALYVHGFDISGDVGAINNVGSPRNTLEVPSINAGGMERVNGLSDGALEIAIWFNDAAGRAHLALSPLPTTDVIMLYQFGSAVGDVAAGLVAKQVNYDWTRGQDRSLAGTVQGLAASGVPLEWLNMLTAGKITHASASSSASKNDGAATSNGIAAILQVVDIDSGTPTVVIQESSDDGAADPWASLISFAAVADGNEPTAERATASGAVEQYLRVTTTGTFTNLDFAVAYRRGAAEDDEAL